MTHDDIEELLGAYALDAVDAAEVDAVEAHLETCARCRDEVQQHRETASFLAQAGGSAPDGLWQRIAAEITETPPALAPVVPFERPGTSRSARLPRWVPVSMAAAAVAVVLSAGLAFKVVDQDRDLRRVENAVTVDGLRQAASAALLHPEARTVDLRSGDGSQWATAVVLPDGAGFIVRDALSPLAPDRTYQLWGMIDDRTVSLGVLGPDPEVVTFRVAAGTTLLALTTEQAGGVVQTRNAPVATGVVPT